MKIMDYIICFWVGAFAMFYYLWYTSECQLWHEPKDNEPSRYCKEYVYRSPS